MSEVTSLPLYSPFRHCRRVWETRLMDVFDRRGNKTCDYVLLRSEQVEFPFCLSSGDYRTFFQLVGTALMIFVKSELTSIIRNVEGTSRKVCLTKDVDLLHSCIFVAHRRGSGGCLGTKERLQFASNITTRVSASSRLTWQPGTRTWKKGMLTTKRS